jgi:hypothetical protein
MQFSTQNFILVPGMTKSQPYNIASRIVSSNSECLRVRWSVSRFSGQYRLVWTSAVLVATLLLLGSLATVMADPGAASFALGGLQFRKEPRISMLKENLSFDNQFGEHGLDFKVTAEYEFGNSTNQPVTIPIAFPVPDDVCFAAISPYRNFAEDQFHVWVEGKEIKHATEARAFQSDEKYIPIAPSSGGAEYTGLLRKFGITPESCQVSDSMPQAARAKLLALGLLYEDGIHANWTVRRKYYWTQTFAVNKITHIKVQYPAQIGYSDVYLGKGRDKGLVQGSARFWKSELSRTCGGAALDKKVEAEISQPDGFAKVYWLDFILVTANYWNGPIQDFVLNVNTGTPHTNFCWDGPIERPDATHFVATAHDFSPKQDLHIGFVEVF